MRISYSNSLVLNATGCFCLLPNEPDDCRYVLVQSLELNLVNKEAPKNVAMALTDTRVFEVAEWLAQRGNTAEKSFAGNLYIPAKNP